MPKKNLNEAIIRRIEAEKRAVRDAAQAFIRAKAAFDRAQKLEGSDTWAQSTEGKGFIAATNAATKGQTATPSATTAIGGVRNFFLGNPEKSIYERTARSEFSYGERLSSYILPKAFGGLDGKTMRNLQRAQEELKAAQITLHNSMDAEFGTSTNRLANGDTSFAEAAKTIAGGFGAVKGVGRILGGLGSIVLGGADDRFGEVHIKNGGLVRTKPRADDRPSLAERFMREDSIKPRGGIIGVLQTPFVAVLNLFRGHPIDAVLTLFKGVESALYLAADTALTLGKVAYLPFNMAFNVAKAGALLAYGGLLAAGTGISAMRGLFREAADFSLKSHVDDRDLDNATDLVLNSLKHADIDKAIGVDRGAKAARDAVRQAKGKEIDAVNQRSGANRSPQQQIEINAAGREAGEAVLNSKKAPEESSANDASKKELTEFEQVKQKIDETLAMQDKLRELKNSSPKKDFSKQEGLLEKHLSTLLSEQERLQKEQPVAERYDDVSDDGYDNASEYSHTEVDNDSEQSMTDQEVLERDFALLEQTSEVDGEALGDNWENLGDDESVVYASSQPSGEPSALDQVLENARKNPEPMDSTPLSNAARADLQYSLDTLEEHNQVEKEREERVDEEKEVHTQKITGGPGSSTSSR